MKRIKEDIASSRDKDAANLWLEVKSLLTECKYYSYKNSLDIASFSLEGYNDTAISVKLNISESTVRWHKMQMSNKLYGIFGEDFFEVFTNSLLDDKEIITNRIRIAKANLMIGADFIEKLLPMDVMVKVRNKVSMVNDEVDFSLDDCIREINFLARYSMSSVSKELDELNSDKMAYLLGIIEGSKGTVEDKGFLFDKLS